MHDRNLLHMSMHNAVIISDMSIICIIKHTHSLRYVADRIDGEPRASVCGGMGRGLSGCAFFLGNPCICCTDVGGDRSGGCSSAAAGQPHHSITL